MRHHFRILGTTGLLLGAACLFTACYVQTSGPDTSRVRSAISISGAELGMEITGDTASVSGIWAFSGTLRKEDEAIFVSVRNRGGAYVLGMPFAASRFSPVTEKRSFRKGGWGTTNDVGEVTYELGSSSKMAGRFAFKPSSNFVEQAAALLSAPASQEELFFCRLRDVSDSELAAYGHCGLSMTATEMLSLKSVAATPEYVSAIRKGGEFTAKDVVRLRSFGVPVEYPVELAKSGLFLKAEDITRLRSYGVSASEAVGWNKTMLITDVSDVTRMHSLGISPEYGVAVKQLFEKTKLDDLIKLRNIGVPESYLREMKEVQAAFTVDDIARLRSYGVSVRYVKAWRNAGYEFDTQSIIRLRGYGVPEESAAALKEAKLSVDDFIKLKSYGVTSDYYLAWRKAGYDFGVQDIVRLHAAGVPATYAAALAVPGRTRMSVEMILKLRMRGLSVEEIRALRE